ncbi:Na/Pi cotransporter family protein [Pleomorphovibrio marinus]|uniref:Na/Pi cotransporter family protein n=1 Tax=Pleomorphovibrio marinus TaxID=2164132 RepID=UPI000E0A7B48|nr:Na/Pi symporter [Pleomorphovibrio marinus]
MEEVSFEFWKFLAGIGIFLWGMQQLEHSLKELAGKSFKNLLHKFTDKPWKGILIGTLITAILQSSSLVTLMVLAFLGGGMISLGNSLGVVLGANLGTTFTAWIVATLGFKVSVADFAFPFLALGTFTYLFINSRPVLRNLGVFMVGFGLLFLGLDFMKTSIEDMAGQVELSEFLSYGLWVFLLIGIVITALIQSSSAMIVIVLSALNAEVIGMTHALALIIGANIGTTFTLVIGALGGTADKKRLSLANFIFKIIAGIATFLLIDQMIWLALEFFRVSDPLMELVLLNTLINIFGILLFYPFLGTLEKWLKKRFLTSEPAGVSRYIKNVEPTLPGVALLALEKEIGEVYAHTSEFIQKVLIGTVATKQERSVWKRLVYQPRDLMKDYLSLKQWEDEITAYTIQLQEIKLTPSEAAKLNDFMDALRTLIYAAKEIKDIIHNIREMENSEEVLVKQLLLELRKRTREYFSALSEYLARYPEMTKIPKQVRKFNVRYNKLIVSLYQDLKEQKTDVPISTLTNVIKQTISGLSLIGEAVQHWKKVDEIEQDTIRHTEY